MKTKKLLLLSATSVLLLSGCAKEITAKEAKEYVDAHYSLEEASAKYSGGSMKTVTKTTKSEGIFEKIYPLGEKTEGPKNVTVTSVGVITSYLIEEGEEYKYFIDGDSLSFECVLTGAKLAEGLGVEGASSDSVKGEYKATWKVNEVGLPVKNEISLNAEVKYAIGGASVTGAVVYSSVVTYTWEAK